MNDEQYYLRITTILPWLIAMLNAAAHSFGWNDTGRTSDWNKFRANNEICRRDCEVRAPLTPSAFTLHVLCSRFCAILTASLPTRHRLEKQSSTTSVIPKSISARFSCWNFPNAFRTRQFGRMSRWNQIGAQVYLQWPVNSLKSLAQRVVSCNMKCEAGMSSYVAPTLD